MAEERFWEIDLLRGLAVVMMIVYHFVLNYSWLFGKVPYELFWFFFGRLTSTAFITLVGLSLTISYSRASKTTKNERKIFTKYLKRGIKILCLGLIVTVASYLWLSSGFILFGILHFIGVSIILAYPFLLFRKKFGLQNSNAVNFISAIAFIIIGLVFGTFTVAFPWLLPIGITPAVFYTYDYFPIFSWFSLVLVGLYLGNSLYPDGKRSVAMKFFERIKIENPLTKLMCFLGRHSLAIYFMHAPILILIFYIMRFL